MRIVRFIKLLIIMAFLVVIVIFLVNYFKEKTATNNTKPTIEFGEDLLEVSVKDKEDVLLKDVIARDKEDGDITKQIVIEDISKFVDKKEHISNITYAVMDSDYNVVKRTRQVKYKDYKKPRFTLSQPLYFDVGSEVNVQDVLGAVDDVDGKINGKVKVLSGIASTRAAGSYVITAQVTNSLGATSKLKTTVMVNQGNNLGPVIKLKKNIVYVKKGEKFDALSYVDSVSDNQGKKLPDAKVKVKKSSVDMKKEGSYMVQYVVNNEEDNEGTTALVVVVEE